LLRRKYLWNHSGNKRAQALQEAFQAFCDLILEEAS